MGKTISQDDLFDFWHYLSTHNIIGNNMKIKDYGSIPIAVNALLQSLKARDKREAESKDIARAAKAEAKALRQEALRKESEWTNIES